MKIINATLNNDTITITLDAKANVHKIYLDSIVNQKNMYSDEDEKHTYVISDFVTQDNTVIVDITEYNETSFIVSVLTSEGNRDEAIAIDQNELYLANNVLEHFFSEQEDCYLYNNSISLSKLRIQAYLLKISDRTLWDYIRQLNIEPIHEHSHLPLFDKILLKLLSGKRYRILSFIVYMYRRMIKLK